MGNTGALLGRDRAPLGRLAPAEADLGRWSPEVPRGPRRSPEVPGGSRRPPWHPWRPPGARRLPEAPGGRNSEENSKQKTKFSKHVFGFSKLGFVLDSSQTANLVNCAFCLENDFLNSASPPPSPPDPPPGRLREPPGTRGPLEASRSLLGPPGTCGDLRGPPARR